MRHGTSGARAPEMDAGAPAAIARAIQLKISQMGTKPTWFMRNSIPAAQGFLRVEVKAALSSGKG